MVRSIQDLVDDISPDALRIKLIDVQLELSSVKQSVIIPTINKFPFGLYFLSYGEICMIHRTFVFKDDYTPFLLPLCFSYIANTHIIITTPSFYQKYPPDLIEIYKKYGYGVYIIENNSLTLVEEPIVHKIIPEAHEQIHNYISSHYRINVLRTPFYTSDKIKIIDPPEILACIKNTSKEDNNHLLDKHSTKKNFMKQAIENSRNIFNNEYISNNKILPLIVKINPNFKGVDNPKLVTNVLAQHYNLNLEKITNEYEIYLKTNILSETGTPTLYKLYIQENGVIS